MELNVLFRMLKIDIELTHNDRGVCGGKCRIKSESTAASERITSQAVTSVTLDSASARKIESMFRDLVLAAMPSRGASTALARVETKESVPPPVRPRT